MRITPEDVVNVWIRTWGTDTEVEYSLNPWDRRVPRVIEFPKIVRYMGKQRKVTKVEVCILKPSWRDWNEIPEIKRIKVRVPEGVEVGFYDGQKKFFDIETY